MELESAEEPLAEVRQLEHDGIEVVDERSPVALVRAHHRSQNAETLVLFIFCEGGGVVMHIEEGRLLCASK